MSLWNCELGAGDTYDIVIDWRRVMALLEAGQVGDVNEIRYGMTILYQAVVHRKLAAIEALLRHGADINLGRQARSSHFEVVAPRRRVQPAHQFVSTLLLSTIT